MITSQNNRLACFLPYDVGFNFVDIPAATILDSNPVDVSAFSEININVYVPPAPAVFNLYYSWGWPEMPFFTRNLLDVGSPFGSAGAFSELLSFPVPYNLYGPFWMFRFSIENLDPVNPQTIAAFMLADSDKQPIIF